MHDLFRLTTSRMLADTNRHQAKSGASALSFLYKLSKLKHCYFCRIWRSGTCRQYPKVISVMIHNEPDWTPRTNDAKHTSRLGVGDCTLQLFVAQPVQLRRKVEGNLSFKFRACL